MHATHAKVIDGANFIVDDIVASSDALGWSHLRAQLRETRHSGAIEEPVAFECDAIAVYTEPTMLWMELDGAGKWLDITPNSIAIIPRGCSLRLRWSAGPRAVSIGLRSLTGTDTLHQSLSVVPVHQMHDAFISQAAGALAKEVIRRGPNGPLFADSLGLALSARLQRLSGTKIDDGTATLGKARLKHIVEFMVANLARNPNVDELAQMAQLSRFHFSRAFKRATGLAPHRYLMQLRVEHVCNAIMNRPADFESLGTLAIQAGFADQAHMTRSVKQLTGRTPAALSAAH